jgi:ABC-type proline/glycine betaine transport system permease subunit
MHPNLELTLVALVAGMAVAIPLGVLVYRFPRVARPVIYLAGTLQTIPSLALLALMIPLFYAHGNARMAPLSQLLYFPTDTFLNEMRLLGGRALVAPVSQVVAASLTGQM